MANSYEPAWNLFHKSKNIVLKNWKVLGLLYIVPFISAILALHDRLANISTKSDHWGFLINTGRTSSFESSALVTTVIAVLAFVTELAVVVAAVNYAQGKKPGIGAILSELMNKGVRLLLLTILSGLVTLAGFVLLIVPGVFLLGRLYLSQYVLVAEDTGIIEAMRRSWHMTAGRMWSVYSLILITLFFALLNILPFIGPLAAILLAWLFSIAPALRYFELKKAGV